MFETPGLGCVWVRPDYNPLEESEIELSVVTIAQFSTDTQPTRKNSVYQLLAAT